MLAMVNGNEMQCLKASLVVWTNKHTMPCGTVTFFHWCTHWLVNWCFTICLCFINRTECLFVNNGLVLFLKIKDSVSKWLKLPWLSMTYLLVSLFVESRKEEIEHKSMSTDEVSKWHWIIAWIMEQQLECMNHN